MLSEEEAKADAGIEPRDMSEVSAWRETTDDSILYALELYGSLLAGQTNGMSESLPLPSVEAAMRIEGVPVGQRRAMAGRLLAIHQRVVEVWKVRHRAEKMNRG